ncbi:hypothetical protein FPOA_07622 [Fusarium poae]|uniref:Uncharacterized protein n=1 Tax=Fusarium poae TaxID=36050 RepID=A0A1B8ALR9_FUSPO|nr:hypothetical protein FPOA_07622 [Fusarium poae]
MAPRKSTSKSKPALETPMRQTRARSKLSNSTPLMQGLDHRGHAQGPLIEKPKARADRKAVDKPDSSPKSTLKKANNKQRRKDKVVFRARLSYSATPPLSPAATSPSSTAQQSAAQEASTLLTPVGSDNVDASQSPSNGDDCGNDSNDAPPAQDNSNYVPSEEDSELSDDAPDSPGFSDSSDPPSPAQDHEDGGDSGSSESPNSAGIPDPNLTTNQGGTGGHDIPVEENEDSNLSDSSDNGIPPSEPNAHCKVLTPIGFPTNTGSSGSSSPSSGSFSPLIMPNPDPEIPSLFGSGVRARPHYGWYEQYHQTGRDCAKVHGCTHNPGRVCHSCHADWQKAWSVYFKAHELLDEAVANPEKYLADTGLDVRKGYMGHLLEGSGWEVLALELQPPTGNSIRLHPTRIAKHRLAFAQMAVDMQ